MNVTQLRRAITRKEVVVRVAGTGTRVRITWAMAEKLYDDCHGQLDVVPVNDRGDCIDLPVENARRVELRPAGLDVVEHRVVPAADEMSSDSHFASWPRALRDRNGHGAEPTEDDVDEAMLRLLADGDAVIVSDPSEEETRFRLTDQGIAKAEALIRAGAA